VFLEDCVPASRNAVIIKICGCYLIGKEFFEIVKSFAYIIWFGAYGINKI